MIWLITDTHLYHDNIVGYCNRPEDHTELILNNWKQMVSKTDEIIHLGDIIFNKKNGGNPELPYLLNWLPGIKHLVLGNHDKKGAAYYALAGFTSVSETLVRDRVHFSHHPSENLRPGCIVNIHGHQHNMYAKSSHAYPKSVLLSIEYEGYKPVPLEEFLKRDYVQESIQA